MWFSSALAVGQEFQLLAHYRSRVAQPLPGLPFRVPGENVLVKLPGAEALGQFLSGSSCDLPLPRWFANVLWFPTIELWLLCEAHPNVGGLITDR